MVFRVWGVESFHLSANHPDDVMGMGYGVWGMG
jgi:hypothetical protein